ncbi:hypothetical protein FA13DRAFT_1798664 [Coprinellus micaceus]|uniref:Uncharacterized protein n=1 Tax=Coprinellus micaceus TaxID=71717 RepID=A0A4Y7SLD1_COPMI|nr:hypothetical protein FA13DRAFT_1798664 [Coprinellus micaceus]
MYWTQIVLLTDVTQSSTIRHIHHPVSPNTGEAPMDAFTHRFDLCTSPLPPLPGAETETMGHKPAIPTDSKTDRLEQHTDPRRLPQEFINVSREYLPEAANAFVQVLQDRLAAPILPSTHPPPRPQPFPTTSPMTTQRGVSYARLRLAKPIHVQRLGPYNLQASFRPPPRLDRLPPTSTRIFQPPE